MKLNINEINVFLKYSLVGIIGTAIDVCTLYLFVEYFKIHVLVATAMSFIIAVVNNFVLNKYWTFQNRDSNIRKQFIKFMIVSIVGISLTELFMVFFVYIAGLWYIISKLFTSLLVLCWNFLANKLWTFKDKIHPIATTGKYDYQVAVIVPAYNEENRIEVTIRAIDSYFQSKKISRQIIVIDDGSSDNTIQVVNTLKNIVGNLEIISYNDNRGKGYAVKTGMMNCCSEYMLFTDADNSTPIEDFDKFLPFLSKHEVLIGSRYLRDSNIRIKQPKYRIFIGRLGNKLIQLILLDGINDTQCGFKVFQHAAAIEIFKRMKVNRFGFDIEVLSIARLLKYSIKEIPVNWCNSPDSRVRPIKDAIRTFKELVYIKLNLWGGRYI